MICVILPSRGLTFSEVEQSISDNLEGQPYKVFRSWNKPIPECENDLVDEALGYYPTHLLFVEEDTVIPQEGYQRMMEANADIAAIDYSVAGWSCITKSKETDEILWCGLGCTLIRRDVFDQLEKPYFRSDKGLLLNDWPKITWVDTSKKNGYGQQDIWFCMHAREKGFSITQVDGECRHLKLDMLGLREVNHGLHQISEKEKITKHQTL